MLDYPSGLDLSSSHLCLLTARIREHRRAIGSRWRRLSAGRQALLTLAHLRNGHPYWHPYAQIAAGFGIGTTTAYRYITEAVDLLTALSPTREQAVREVSRKAFVLLDGTVAADQPFYSGKHKKHGMNVQVLADPAGRLLWASPALPGAVHDIRAAREHGFLDGLTSADLDRWADKGYQGAGQAVRVPHRGRWENLSEGQQAVNLSQAKIRVVVEPAITTRKTRQLRCSTTRITSLVQAVLTLHLTLAQTEVGKGSLRCSVGRGEPLVWFIHPGVLGVVQKALPLVAFTDWPPGTPRRLGCQLGIANDR